MVAFPAGYDNDDTYTYAILDDIAEINKFYMDADDIRHSEFCDIEGCDGCVYGRGWIVEGADGVTELYFEIFSTDALRGVQP